MTLSPQRPIFGAEEKKAQQRASCPKWELMERREKTSECGVVLDPKVIGL